MCLPFQGPLVLTVSTRTSVSPCNRVHIVGDRDNALMCDQVDLSEYGNLSSVETLGILTMGLLTGSC